MASLEIDPDADDEYERLRNNDPQVSRAVDRILDDLEEEPHKPYLRRSYLRPRGIYKVLVPTAVGEPDHMILWDMEGDIVVVRYLGPNFLNA